MLMFYDMKSFKKIQMFWRKCVSEFRLFIRKNCAWITSNKPWMSFYRLKSLWFNCSINKNFTQQHFRSLKCSRNKTENDHGLEKSLSMQQNNVFFVFVLVLLLVQNSLLSRDSRTNHSFSVWFGIVLITHKVSIVWRSCATYRAMHIKHISNTPNRTM